MPAYSYAVISAILWAISAPILNAGLKRIPREQWITCVFTGLLVAQLTGTLTLTVILAATAQLEFSTSGYLIAAGLFTFPLATGLYYLSGYAFGTRIEFASQFAKIKPLFSVLLALLVLKETFGTVSYIALTLILLGLMVLTGNAWRGALSWRAVLLGLLAALAWAAGEVFMKLGLHSALSLTDTFTALASATVISLVLFMPALLHAVAKHVLIHSWLLAFGIHGIISFALAYASFFESIRLIGLSRTVLINAFWPILAIVLTCLWQRLQRQPCEVPNGIWLAAILVLAGSLIQGLALEISL